MAEQETFIRKSLQKMLKSNIKKSLTTLQEEQKTVEQAITLPHGFPWFMQALAYNFCHIFGPGGLLNKRGE